MDKVVISDADLRDMMFAFVIDYYNQSFEATRSQWLSQRFAKRALRLGYKTVADVVKSDPRYMWRITKKGAMLVAPRERVETEFKDVIHKFWEAHGVSLY